MTAPPVEVVAIGGALVDVRAVTGEPWQPGRSLPGRVRVLAGGAARNVAVNLARLGRGVALLSAVGTDPLADWLLHQTGEAGVDVSHVLRRPQPTGVFVTVGAERAEPYGVSDAGPLESLTADDLGAWMPVIGGAAMVITDANIPASLHPVIAGLATARSRALLATSPAKAPRLRAVLAGAALLVCNREEALAITGLPPTVSWQALGTALLVEGVERVVITRGREGVGVLTAEEAVASPALQVEVVDPTGAGDAVAAAAIHAQLAGLDAGRTAGLAAEAAAIVVQSSENTPQAIARTGQR